MLTIHTSGGLAMMQAAEESAQRTAAQCGTRAPLVLGVTVLTSMSSEELPDVGVNSTASAQVERLAALAARAGLRGLVCSPLEVPGLRRLLPRTVELVTPGIRGAGDAAGDQKRTLSAREAMEAGSSWLVIGRPIYSAPDPRAAAEAIAASIAQPRP
jgi:orotidine-5'-phosphate decarboxylase